MITPEQAREMALALEGVEEKPHFNRVAFTVKKKIFATLSFEDKTLNLMFSPELQFIYCPPKSEVIYPVPNKWGKKGATTIHLPKATKALVQSALKDACNLTKAK